MTEMLLNDDSGRRIFSIDTGNLTREEAERAIQKAQKKKKKLNEGNGSSGPQLLNE
jgi:hypothetical protein